MGLDLAGFNAAGSEWPGVVPTNMKVVDVYISYIRSKIDETGTTERSADTVWLGVCDSKKKLRERKQNFPPDITFRQLLEIQ
ncbi:helix-turn-helix domain-containing protein [Paenibacillus monticola]|uniref:Uncharacterized protein n=1 Tax=Paenibacillus monticola TaxID=2666075 RepID=A0A7X2L225_9BACL|nr:helix-turn-helix domain-containing protein [Paenibacillus monticola]MRN54412.1 hypothetical protein [Paenibacillus monticola]